MNAGELFFYAVGLMVLSGGMNADELIVCFFLVFLFFLYTFQGTRKKKVKVAAVARQKKVRRASFRRGVVVMHGWQHL